MNHQKIGPGLMCTLGDYESRGRSALALRARMMGISGVSGSQKEPRIVVFLRCDESERFDDLRGQGIVINEPDGKVRTAYVPVSDIDKLSQHPAVHRIGATRVAKPRLDVALPFTRVSNFRTTHSLNGSGVIIGIVDSGIDPNHPDFAGRILRIWDQTITGPGVAEANFGLELTGAAITASRDINGHGTHVAGIATGADSTFNGVAPGASIVFVKTDFNTGHIANGIQYIFRVARELGRPAVINLSLGSHFDAHDGTDDLSTFIDQLSGPGCIVCCAAGNEGEDNIHARTGLEAGGNRQIRFSVPAESPGVVLSGWYPASDNVEIAIQGPNNQQTPFQGVIGAGNHTRVFTLGASRVLISTPGQDLASGDNHFEVQISANDGGGPHSGVWKLLVRTDGSDGGLLDVWASDFEAGSTIHFLDNVSDEMKIGSPGASKQGITVASFTTRASWTDIDGNTEQVSFSPTTISPFSSPGPLRNGLQKPDVAAPGAMIVSALSADSGPERGFIINKGFRMDAGTSMATPFITGLVALLLEQDHTLIPNQVKARINAGSKIPDQAPGTFLNQWGFGLIHGDLL
jgi:subtilisin family serine protease